MSQSIRDSIIAFAESEVGITESPPGSNIVKYNDWYYPEYIDEVKKKKHPYFIDSSEYAWCFTFLSYIYHYSGWTMPPIDSEIGGSYVPTLHYKAIKNGWVTKTPKPGDLVTFDFKANDKLDIQHIGLFHSWIEEGKTFWTIEGNTSFDEKGSQANGGAVAKRKRSVANVIQFVNLIDNIK